MPAETLQLPQNLSTALGQFRIVAFGKPASPADQVCKACLTQPGPFLINAVSIADKNTVPVLDQLQKGDHETFRMHHEVCRRLAGHPPQPSQFALCPPRRFIDVVHSCGLCNVANCFVMRFDGRGYAIKYFLDSTLADGQIEDREKKILNSTAAVAVRSAKLGLSTPKFLDRIPRVFSGGTSALVELCRSSCNARKLQPDVFDDQLSRRQFRQIDGCNKAQDRKIRFRRTRIVSGKSSMTSVGQRHCLPMPFTLATAF